MSRQPSDTWLTHDDNAEQLDAICERCGGELAVAVDPEGSHVYCTDCPPKHKTQTKPNHGTDNNHTH